MKYRWFLLFLSGFMVMGSFSGCNNLDKPKNLIPENKYDDLYVEFQLLRAYRHLYGDTTKIKLMRQRILDKYGVTLEQFRKSDAYYEALPGQDDRIHKALDQISTVKDSIWNADKSTTRGTVHPTGNSIPKPNRPVPKH